MAQYRHRISGPLLDRIDLHVDVPALAFDDLSNRARSESSASIRSRVMAARAIQHQRFAGMDFHCNAHMPPSLIEVHCVLDEESRRIFRRVSEHFGLSARAYHRVLRMARTIADLDNSPGIRSPHLMEAVQYRVLDRSYQSAA